MCSCMDFHRLERGLKKKKKQMTDGPSKTLKHWIKLKKEATFARIPLSIVRKYCQHLNNVESLVYYHFIPKSKVICMDK